MEIHEKYVVYELNSVMGSKDHLALQKVQFSGYMANSFSSEKDAIQGLVDDGRIYEDFVILKQVYITK